MNYRNILEKGSSILKNNLISTPKLDAELLLSLIICKSREGILLNLEQRLSKNEIKKFNDLINRRIKKEPISQITGRRFFWKSEFSVDKNVLTPRFETELLVEQILKDFKFSDKLRILDVGIGSGCILLSLLSEKNNWRGVGIDISKMAINIAKLNAKIQQIDNRVKFINSHIDNFFDDKYDIVVSNPPYINIYNYNNLDLGVKGYEPRIALYGGIDGTKIIEKVIKKSNKILKNGGTLAMEIGIGQFFKVCELLRNNSFYISKTVEDYQKIRRCLIAKKIN
jgi:release factor glutamine methyltransferase